MFYDAKDEVMKRVSPNIIIATLIFFFSSNQGFSAGGQVDLLSGKVQTIYSKKEISVFLLDTDGSILDIGTLDTQGNYQLDLTVMDDPMYEILVKLKVRLQDKKGNKKEVKISESIEQFIDKKVKLEQLTFP